MRPDVVLALSLLAAPLVSGAQEASIDWDGHLKGRVLAEWFPETSVFRADAGAALADTEADVRLNLQIDRGRWSFNGAYQGFAAVGEGLRIANLASGVAALPDDGRRLFDLTHVVTARDETTVMHRVDRLYFGYTDERRVVRIGRQAITWGGGLLFSPFDIVNPFDPAQIDTEYKPGDDMLYAQLLRDNGDDLQFAYVARRDAISGDVRARDATVALKYHGISGDSEYDILIAQNYDRPTLGVGGNRSIGGAVLRGDVLISDVDDPTLELVVNLSYSWVWGGKNITGAAEYYYNGFGQSGGRYDSQSLASNPELIERLARAETFTIGRNYLGASVTIELSPLWTLTPNLFANIDDPSALLQVVANHSFGDNVTLLAAVNLPIGPEGSEYGGIQLEPAGFASRTAGIFGQLAWYFQ